MTVASFTSILLIRKNTIGTSIIGVLPLMICLMQCSIRKVKPILRVQASIKPEH